MLRKLGHLSPEGVVTVKVQRPAAFRPVSPCKGQPSFLHSSRTLLEERLHMLWMPS